MSDDNVRVVRRYVDGMVTAGTSASLRSCAPRTSSTTLRQMQPGGTEEMKQFFQMLATAFPRLLRCGRGHLRHRRPSGDALHFSGTHEGEFMGVPASGARVVMSRIDIARIADGRIRLWGHEDWLAHLHQMGVSIPGGDGSQRGPRSA
jgi:hypothetical protein